MTCLWYYLGMPTASISQLKVNPSAVLAMGEDFPVALQNRGKTQGYYFGKAIAEKLIALLEDIEDRKVIENTDFSKGRDFNKIAQELGL